MKPLFFILILTFGLPCWAMESAGHVVDLKGEVWITPAGGMKGKAQFQNQISVGDIVETKQTGAVKILFVDDTLLALKENSRVQINSFLFEPQAKKRHTVIQAFFGRIRTVVGMFLGEDQTVLIKTPTAVAGIRGTDVGAEVKRRSTLFYCFDGSTDAYNIRFPDKKVSLKKGVFVEIFKNIAPLQDNVLPIPADIQEKMFDISWIPSSIEKREESKGVGEKLSDQTRDSLLKEATGTGQPASNSKNTGSSGDETTMDKAQTANENQTQAVQSTSQSPTQTGTEILPGATTESAAPSTITITFPH